MQQTGLLTIGIPTFNGCSNLPELLTSIKNLGLKDINYEILIVDNGSTDHTEQIVALFLQKYPNIIYHKNEANIGRIENWNKVVELASGEYLILMNVNDRFLDFDVPTYLNYLKSHPGIALVMNDVLFESYQYPKWSESGVIDLEAYIKKTFLDNRYLEFNSLGVLQQHIFRTNIIKEHNIRFDPFIPRTTDRIFIARVIKEGGGKFLYSAQPIVTWRLSENRYHNQVHNGSDDSQFNALWGDEYKANTEVAKIANISYHEILNSQLVLASFLRLAKWVQGLKSFAFNRPIIDKGIGISMAPRYYRHLKLMAKQNQISINIMLINAAAVKRAALLFIYSLRTGYSKPRKLRGSMDVLTNLNAKADM